MSTHIIKLVRDVYTKQTTLGKVFINGQYFSYSLEDTVRPYGVKVKHHTAIPGGTPSEPIKYKVKISHSSRFNRETVYLYSEDDEVTLKAKGISFMGIRVHGGNTHAHSSGCPLVAKNRINDEKIQGSMESEFTEKVRELLKTCDVEFWVINQPQSN